MLNDNCTKRGVGALELRHDIGGQREQWYEYQNDAALHHAERLKDMRLSGICLLNYSKMIGKQGMKKTICCIKLCRKHVLDTPNQRGGSGNAQFQSIIVGPCHRNDPRCVGRRPIVKSIARGMAEGFIVISL